MSNKEIGSVCSYASLWVRDYLLYVDIVNIDRFFGQWTLSTYCPRKSYKFNMRAERIFSLLLLCQRGHQTLETLSRGSRRALTL